MNTFDDMVKKPQQQPQIIQSSRKADEICYSSDEAPQYPKMVKGFSSVKLTQKHK